MHLESQDLAQQLLEAYRSQARARDFAIGNNGSLAGWKLGGNSAGAREIHGVGAPFLGFLMKAGHHESGCILHVDDISETAFIEVELCFRIGPTLRGSGLTAGDVRAHVAGVAPAFEILGIPAQSGRDAASIVAANVFQWGYVLGAETSPRADMNFGRLAMKVTSNDHQIHDAACGAGLDDALESVAWLVERLDLEDRAIEAGQIVLTGACFGPAPLQVGDIWSAEFEELGRVSANFN